MNNFWEGFEKQAVMFNSAKTRLTRGGIGAALGGAFGGAAGYYGTTEEKNKARNAIGSGIVGALAGGAIGAARKPIPVTHIDLDDAIEATADHLSIEDLMKKFNHPGRTP